VLGVAVPSYRFTGYGRTGYFAYRDLATGKMLIADPGGVYEMQSVTLADPVPPGDGRWEAVPAATVPPPPPLVNVAPPPPPPPPAPAPAPAPVEDPGAAADSGPAE
jgi:hypothetical protein